MIIIKDGCMVLLRLGEIPFPSPPLPPPFPPVLQGEIHSLPPLLSPATGRDSLPAGRRDTL